MIAASIIPPFDWHRVMVEPWTGANAIFSAQMLALGFLIGAVCGTLGVFLILRRNALAGDAISHSVLPGLVLAYIVLGTISSGAMLAGAAVAGVASVLLIEVLQRKSRTKSDAATGVVFTSLFALGMLLLRRFADRVHLDVECVLYGNIELAMFEQWKTPLGALPVALVTMFILGGIILGGLVLFYKQWLVTSFDPALATSLGMKTAGWHYLLMAATSMVVVAALEAVGVVLVVGMMILPAAAARLLASRLPSMLGITVLMAFLGALIGRHLSAWWNTPLAPSMALGCGCCFFSVWLGQLAWRRWQRA
jgi:manganese/zinc/iron transport system permease protein